MITTRDCLVAVLSVLLTLGAVYLHQRRAAPEEEQPRNVLLRLTLTDTPRPLNVRDMADVQLGALRSRLILRLHEGLAGDAPFYPDEISALQGIQQELERRGISGRTSLPQVAEITPP